MGDHQGQSYSTEFKERGLEAAFAINLRVFFSKMGARYRYWHFDLNCGSGINEQIGCIGSPLAFLRAASKWVDGQNGLHYFAGFCDTNPLALGELMARQEMQAISPKDKQQKVFCFHGRNASLIEAIPHILKVANDKPQYATGMLLSDPNGAETPIEEMAWLSGKCPRMDVVIHWNSRIRRLYRGQGWAFVDIDEAINQIGKQHWLIRKPMGAHQWTVLIGRNTKIGEHRTMGFYHLESEMGRDILARCKARIDAQSDPQLGLEL